MSDRDEAKARAEQLWAALGGDQREARTYDSQFESSSYCREVLRGVLVALLDSLKREEIMVEQCVLASKRAGEKVEQAEARLARLAEKAQAALPFLEMQPDEWDEHPENERIDMQNTIGEFRAELDALKEGK